MPPTNRLSRAQVAGDLQRVEKILLDMAKGLIECHCVAPDFRLENVHLPEVRAEVLELYKLVDSVREASRQLQAKSSAAGTSKTSAA
jgi:hypothetical protein